MISLGLTISAAEMEDSSEDENIYIMPLTKLNEKKGINPAKLTVFFETGKVQERNEEIDKNTKTAEHVTNCKMFEGKFASLI